MDIATRISELLFNYECVVLPEFGGFITNDKPAQINRITHQFKPPHREILFNVQLTANDGLLAKHISEKESISYKAAKQKIAEFVSWCRDELQSGRQVEFAQIGTLFFDDAQNIVFEQDQHINYNPDSFGLSSLVSPAIKRTSQQEKIKDIILPVAGTGKRTDRRPERGSDEKKSQSRKTYYHFPIAIAGLLLAVIVVTSLFLSQQSSVISLAGLFPSSSTETVTEVVPKQTQVQKINTNELTSLPVQETGDNATTGRKTETELIKNDNLIIPVEEDSKVKTEVTDEANKNLEIIEVPLETNTNPLIETPNPPKPTIDKSKQKIQPTGRQYYIIAGSFSKEKNAQKLIVQLTEKGYAAMVADTNKNGMYRVAYAGFVTKTEAKQELLAIRQDENADAWLLRK